VPKAPAVLPETYPITAPLKGAPRTLEKAAEWLSKSREDEAKVMGKAKAPKESGGRIVGPDAREHLGR
jgi:hypothetical protein